jgi:hypothetical protein
LNRVFIWGLWIATIVALLLSALQGLSGHWIVFFLIWPMQPPFGQAFINAMVKLSSYHRMAGFAVGGLSVLILFFAFASKSSIYTRIFAVVGFAMTVLAAYGGYLYVTSGFQDRWSLGQMADAFIGVFGAYFIQLLFMIKTPGFPWLRSQAD